MFTAEQESIYKAGLARFRRNDKVVIGAGFYVNDDHILTCAHVVTQCLNLGKKPQEIAADTVRGKSVEGDFPFVAMGQFQTEIVPELWRLNNQDLAVLKIVKTIPEGVFPLLCPESTFYRGNPFHVYGFPEGHSEGIWARGEFLGELTNGRIQMEDTKAQGLAIEPGFSGAPVWDEVLGAIAGIAVARDKNREEAKVGFMIPYEKLKPALEAIALFELLLPEATQLAPHWQAAYRLLRPENAAAPFPTTLAAAIVQLQNTPSQGSQYRSIDQFVGYLALPELGLHIQPRLILWLQNQSLNVEHLLEEVKQKKPKQPASVSAPHLLFWVQAELNSDRYYAQSYLIPNGEHYDPVMPTGVKQLKNLAELFEAEQDEKVSQSQLEQALQKCLNESVAEINQEDFPLLQVEIFLPRQCLNWPVDQWQTDEETEYNPNPEPIGYRYRVVLRLSDRLDRQRCTPQMTALWKKKWKALKTSTVTRLACGDKENLDTLRSALADDEVVGWHQLQPPQSVSQSAPCAFSILVGTGAAVAVWLRQPIPNQRQKFSPLLNGCLSELPDRVHRLRQAAYGQKAKKSLHIGKFIGLIWEDPRLVPPTGNESSRLRMPS